jgi:hypothetical protein
MSSRRFATNYPHSTNKPKTQNAASDQKQKIVLRVVLLILIIIVASSLTLYAYLNNQRYFTAYSMHSQFEINVDDATQLLLA